MLLAPSVSTGCNINYEVCALNDNFSVVEWNSKNKIECMADYSDWGQSCSALWH